MSDYKVEMVNDSACEFHVEFHGPKESPYEGGVWKVHVELPGEYPYKSPSIGFVNRLVVVRRPNRGGGGGAACLECAYDKGLTVLLRACLPACLPSSPAHTSGDLSSPLILSLSPSLDAQNISPQRGRAGGQCVPRRHQPDVVANV